MFYYRACGLNILSALKIDFLEPTKSSKKDIDIFLSSSAFDQQLFTDQNLIFGNDTVHYLDKHGVCFEITKSKIIIYNHPEITSQEISISLLGIPFGYLLRLNDYYVVHGSAIAIANKAVCFFGKTGIGKSSIAANFLNNKNKFLTEDLCIFKNGSIYNLNSWIKVSNETAEIIKEGLEENIDIKNDSRKRNLCKISKNYVFDSQARPQLAYFPKQSDKCKIVKMNLKEKFENIYANSYRLGDRSISDLNHITNIIEGLDCYFFERDIQNDISENMSFLEGHMKNLL